MNPYYQDSLTTLYQGDCLDVMATLPSSSIDLIATDPPYFRVKDEPWDRQWDTAQGFLDWMGQLCEEWKRILKPNGSLYVFASPDMARRVEAKIGETFNVLNNIRWLKEQGWHKKADEEALRSYLSPWEAVIFAEHCNSVYGNEPDALLKQASAPLAQYISQERERAGVSRQVIAAELARRGIYKNEQTGAAMCSDWEYGDSLPPESAYRCLQDVLNRNGSAYLSREYDDVAREFRVLRDKFRDLRRPFALNGIRDDIWRFDTVQPYPGKHPCEKPMSLMRHIIRTSSRPGDTVLDCFAGSGVTLRAAKDLGRCSVGVEKVAHYCHTARQRLAPAFEAALVDASTLDDLPLFAQEAL